MVEFLTGNHVGKIAGRCHHVFWPKFRPVGFPVFPPPISLHLQVLTIHRAVIRASACHATLNCGHWISFFWTKSMSSGIYFFQRTGVKYPVMYSYGIHSTINLWICSLSHTGSTHASLLLHNVGASLASAPICHSTKNMLNGHIQNHISTKVMDWWLTGHQSQATFNPKTIKVWAFEAFRSLQLFICDFLSILLRTAT